MHTSTAQKKILIIGDIMIDHYIHGDVHRISPEAPVPVVLAREENYKLGGAANVAANLAQSQVKVTLMGMVGDDEIGKQVRQQLDYLNIEPKLIVSETTPTTVKTRIMAMDQQILRIDKESVYMWNDPARDILSKQIPRISPDLIVVSDYNKGFITSDTMQIIMQYCKAKNVSCLVDPKGCDWSIYHKPTLIKPNLKELEDITGSKVYNTDESVVNAVKKIVNQIPHTQILVTRGSKGMTLVDGNDIVHFGIASSEVYDVTGAGDTVMAMLALMYVYQFPLHDCIRAANAAGMTAVRHRMTYMLTCQDIEEIMAKNQEKNTT